MQHLPHGVLPALLTTNQAHEYAGNRPFFESVLVELHGLTPLYIGKSDKTVFWSREAIDTLLRKLELNGGYDANTSRPIDMDTYRQRQAEKRTRPHAA